MRESTAATYVMLASYGNDLAAAGFEVWLTPTTFGAYLQYRDPATGACGTFAHSDHEGWGHSMPIVPSREFGSSMFIDTAADVWTVDAARETAQLTNRNPVVGTQRNAADRTWRSPSARPLHEVADAATFPRT